MKTARKRSKEGTRRLLKAGGAADVWSQAADVSDALAVGFAAMPDAVDGDDLSAVIDGEQNPIIADAQPIAVHAGELFNLRASRFCRKLLSVLEDETALWSRDATEVLFDPPVVGEGVHGLEQALSLQALDEVGMGDEAAARSNRLSQDTRIVLVLSTAQEPLVVDKRQDDRSRLPLGVDNELLRLDFRAHDGFPSTAGHRPSIVHGV